MIEIQGSMKKMIRRRYLKIFRGGSAGYLFLQIHSTLICVREAELLELHPWAPSPSGCWSCFINEEQQRACRGCCWADWIRFPSILTASPQAGCPSLRRAQLKSNCLLQCCEKHKYSSPTPNLQTRSRNSGVRPSNFCFTKASRWF